MCLHPSSKRTGHLKLLVMYSAELILAKGVSHSVSGSDVHIHLEERDFGFFIICKYIECHKIPVGSRYCKRQKLTSFSMARSFGASDWIYLEW